MNRVEKAVAIFISAVSVFAFIAALLGGSMLLATEGVLRLLGFRGEGLGYPLGNGVLLVYACGLALGVTAARWPAAAALALLPLAVGAFLYGGPVAKLFAIAIGCAAAILLASRWLSQARSGRHAGTS